MLEAQAMEPLLVGSSGAVGGLAVTVCSLGVPWGNGGLCLPAQFRQGEGHCGARSQSWLALLGSEQGFTLPSGRFPKKCQAVPTGRVQAGVGSLRWTPKTSFLAKRSTAVCLLLSTVIVASIRAMAAGTWLLRNPRLVGIHLGDSDSLTLSLLSGVSPGSTLVTGRWLLPGFATDNRQQQSS